MHDGGGGDEQEQEVLADELLAQISRRLGPLHELDDLIVGASAELLHPSVSGQSHREKVAQTPVLRLQRADSSDKAGEALPGVGCSQRLLSGLGIFSDLVQERRGDQLLPARKASVEGGDADPGAQGYLLQRGLEPLLCEHLLGSGEEGGPIALRVCSQPTRGRFEWGSSCLRASGHAVTLAYVEESLRNLLA